MSAQDIKLNLTEVYNTAQALELAIKRKAFTQDEVKKLYTSWSNTMRFCEDVKRKSDIEKLYSEPTKTEDVVETLEN